MNVRSRAANLRERKIPGLKLTSHIEPQPTKIGCRGTRRGYADDGNLPTGDTGRGFDCPYALRGRERGFFTELYNAEALEKAGIADTFVQDNMSLSVRKGTVRGLHFQGAPYSQSKLVRVSRGRILDVAFDLRPTSPTFQPACHG